MFMGLPWPWRNPCARPCEHVSLSVLTMRCAIPNTTETNSQRRLTEDPNPSTKWTQTRPLWQAQSDHAALLVCLDSQHQWEWTLPRGFASRWLDALHLWWRGPSEPRLVVVETRRPVEKQTANQDPAPSSPVCPDDHCARDRICVRAQMANNSEKRPLQLKPPTCPCQDAPEGKTSPSAASSAQCSLR